MTTSEKAAAPSYALLRAAEAITNWRALAMCAIAGVATLIAGMLTTYTIAHSFFLGLVSGLVTLGVMLVGYSAVGITLMRQAQGHTIGFVDAMLQAVFTAHRFLGVGILLLLGYLAVLLAGLLIFLLCKIPGLGPLLYAFAFPVVAVVIGATFAGLWYVGYPLAAPAIWEGNSAVQTVARLIQISRHRLLQVIVNMFLLLVLVAVLSIVVFGILGYGALISTSLSSAVGASPMSALLSMFSGFMGPFGRSYGGGFGRGDMAALQDGIAYASSFGFGAGLLLMIALVIPFLTFINGTCLIYLQTVNGMDFSDSEAMLKERMAQARRQAEQARDRAVAGMRETKESPQAKASVQAVEQVAAPVSVALACHSCHAPMAPDDLFCGECGAKRSA
ncbi:zinc ribbon domain-containing protein [Cupriavidus necator]|uniref:zinc ribbon domain-containing protein n=1 Tax=Cupriavidus necator TaxID=106590 RepID=UPI00339D5C00